MFWPGTVGGCSASISGQAGDDSSAQMARQYNPWGDHIQVLHNSIIPGVIISSFSSEAQTAHRVGLGKTFRISSNNISTHLGSGLGVNGGFWRTRGPPNWSLLAVRSQRLWVRGHHASKGRSMLWGQWYRLGSLVTSKASADAHAQYVSECGSK